MAAFIGQLSVDLVRKHIQIMLYAQLRDGPQVFPCHDGSCGIVGEGQDQDLGSVRDLLFQILRLEAELVLFLQFHHHGLSAGQTGAGIVGNIAGSGNQDLVSGIDHGPEHKVDGFGSAHGDKDLAVIVVAQVLGPFHICGHFHLQLLEAGVGSIESAALLQRIDALIPDVPGGIEIRLAHAQ